MNALRPLAIGLLIFVVTTAVLATGLPVAFGLGIVALLFMFMFDGWNGVEFMAETLFAGLNDFTLVSIPMFVLMGAAVASSRAGSDLYEALARWLHRVPGSLVVANIGACALFSALTGSSPATCAAIGKMGIPEMRRRGYRRRPRHRLDRRRRHAGHPDPARDHDDPLRHRSARPRSVACSSPASCPGIMLTALFMLWAVFLSWRRGMLAADAARSYS